MAVHNTSVMKLIDKKTNLMECKICGAKHHGQIKANSGGKLYRKNWQCQNGCKF